MASSATPMGARPVSSLVSCAYNAKITHYKSKMHMELLYSMAIL